MDSKKPLLGIVLTAFAHAGFAQAVTPMEFEVQATMLAPQGVVTSCGLSFNGAAVRSGPSPEADQVAGSIAVHLDMDSLVKGGHQIVFLQNGKPATRLAGDQVAWIRIEGGVPLAPINGKFARGEKPPYHLFAVKMENAIEGMTSMLAGKTIWIGFSANGSTSSIFSGRVKRDQEVSQQFRSCISELIAAKKS